MVTFDEPKRQENIAKHKLDFLGCDAVFDHPVVTTEDTREAYGEERLVLVGMSQGQLLAVVYTERGERVRIISARKATKHEQDDYFRQNAP